MPAGNWIETLSSLENIGAVKAAIAALACVLIVLERRSKLSTRWRQLIAAAVAAAAVCGYFHFYQLEHKAFYHRWEFFHYYLGSKYTQELGYERLYHCAALADAETGNLKSVRHRRMRDLTVDLLVPASQALDNPGWCKDHFSPARWDQFKSDVVWFRAASGSGKWWNDMQGDHGYNPSPVWTLTGHALASIAPPGDGFFKGLAAIDVTLTALVFIALGWAFGWRVLLVAAVYWATQEPASFFWTGGAFLRQDWLLLTVLAVALLRKGWFFWAGVALAWASLLRVFPALLWAGPLVVTAAHLWRKRALAPSHRNMLLGGALACAILVPSSMHVAGKDSFREFAHHIRVHDASPITNHMSLRTVLSSTPEGRMKYTVDPERIEPMHRWQDARRARFASLQWLFYGVNAAVIAAFAFACWKMRTLWLTVPLGLALVVCMVDPTCYYYSVWILAAVLTRANRTLELPVIGAALASQMLSWNTQFADDKYASLAALYVGFTVGLLWFFMRDPRSHPRSGAPFPRSDGGSASS
ncbi:MAG: hypothetical protein HY898_11485 [Deltaproteobacteria bacterium]|nr:hypothetical protein [Deltaproteobacteria bacterium]